VPIQVTCSSCNGKFNAPDSAAGKRTKCPTCGGVIQIPTPPAPKEDILEAEPVPGSIYSDEDFEVEKPPELPEDRDTKPCPMCGEKIQRNAMKCRHCGEIFDPLLKAQQRSVSSSSNSADADMTAVDWVLCILCSGIACILAIIYIIQGKPKGTKMLVVALCVQAFWFVVQLMLGMLQQGG